MSKIDIPKIKYLGHEHSIIYTKDGSFLSSYDSIIAYINIEGRVQLGKNWRSFNTTGKYRNLFLKEKGDITIKKLKSGVYTINTDL